MENFKPRVCLIDEDLHVKQGWEATLGSEAEVLYFPNPQIVFNCLEEEPNLLSTVDCAIVSRYVREFGQDIYRSDISGRLKEAGVKAVFLNWQGQLKNSEILEFFDGRLFNRYGVRWSSLQSRLKKVDGYLETTGKQVFGSGEVSCDDGLENDGEDFDYRPLELQVPYPNAAGNNKEERCRSLLTYMACQAEGTHKERLLFFAVEDLPKGVRLLEALLDRLQAKQHSTAQCPSRYIDSSAKIAELTIQYALVGSKSVV